MRKSRSNQPQIDSIGALPKQWCAVAQHNWVDGDPVLIDQALLGECGGQAGAAQDHNVVAGLCFELCNFFRNMVAYQARIIPSGLAQRCRNNNFDEINDNYVRN
jgi:hypothetical protein